MSDISISNTAELQAALDEADLIEGDDVVTFVIRSVGIDAAYMVMGHSTMKAVATAERIVVPDERWARMCKWEQGPTTATIVY